MAAVRRLGQIQGQKAVGLLLERFAKEPSPRGLHRVALVKLEIIRALGRIGGEQAKSAVLNIAETYWRRGPHCKCKKCKDKGLYPWHDGDYSSVTPSTLKALQKWKHDEKVFDLSSQIALDMNIRSTPVRVSAWELHLITNIAKEGIVTEEQSLRYLINFLVETGIQPETYVVKDGVGIRTLKSIKTDAVDSILKRYGEPAVSYLKKELKQASPADKNLLQALNHAINRIKKSLKLRVSKKEQMK